LVVTRRTFLSVVGARPNFMKLAPLARVLGGREGLRHVVVHTGQHYDVEMSDAFFRDLDIPAPDHNLGVGSGSHAAQTAAIMQRLEPVLLAERPEAVLVYGDVNSTVAAALVAAKLGVRVGHVEAGLRSRDWSMPEEINRVVTDRLSDLLFTPSRDADENLRNEGIPPERVHFVGNIMIDSLAHVLPRARALNVAARYGVDDRPYVVTTLHRPSNVDDPAVLRGLVEALQTIARDVPVIFPVHPRTRAKLDELPDSVRDRGQLHLIVPVGYVEMLSLVTAAALVVTDSGGLQEETSYLGVPCVTVRPNTERPITCTAGTNRLAPPEPGGLVRAARDALADGRAPLGIRIPRWDGETAQRVAGVLLDGEAYH
jgi:UDP-N-acetylglucosamine 2-epimerase (non-hydrolysing)